MKHRSLVAPVLLAVVLATTCCGCSGHLDRVAGTPGFVMSDNLMGTVLKASDRSEVGKRITFVGLLTDTPQVVFESGVTSPLKKVFEESESMTLLLVASATGSIDAFVIDKSTGKFSRAAVGDFLGEVYASAWVGRCK
jgi:hypothetical protein